MKGLRSLRLRVLMGAALWTIGLFIVGCIVMTQVMFTHPNAPRVFHMVLAHVSIVSFAAVIFLAAGIWEVRRGLSAIGRLRARVSAMQQGQERRIDGEYPAEVQPLVDDMNSMLAYRDQAVQRALAKAGDLAHGLKTPLAVLAQEAERARAAGQMEIAAAIDQHVDRMRRQIDYHLAQARAAASGATPGTRSSVADCAEGLARTMRQLHTKRELTIEINVPPEAHVRCQREDLDEMLGNLMDNACKWAKSRVVVSSTARDASIVISVDDDGDGLAADKREWVLRRGTRADEAVPGSGLGLAITRDLAELYGGTVALDQSQLGGLRVSVTLPESEIAR